MTKTFRIIGMVLMAVLMSVGFAACSSDDDEDDGMQLDSSSSSFVGYWIDDTYDTDLLLLDNGVCLSPSSTRSDVYYSGKWVFDESTKYLSNTAKTATYQLTTWNETDFMGINISNNKTVSYHKDNSADAVVDLLVMGEMVSTSGDTLNIQLYSNISGTKVPSLPSNTSSRRYTGKYILLNIDSISNSSEASPTIYGDYKIRWEGKYYARPDNKWYDNTFDSNYKGKVIIEHPFSPNKTTITFTGCLEGTYKYSTKQN